MFRFIRSNFMLFVAFFWLSHLAPTLKADTHPTKAKLMDQYRNAAHRVDSLWYYGNPSEQILFQLESIRDAACTAGFDDLYVLVWTQIARFYAYMDNPEAHGNALKHAYQTAQAHLPAKSPAYAVSAARYAKWYFDYEPEDVPPIDPVSTYKAAITVLKGTEFKRELFWCQLGIAMVFIDQERHFERGKPWLSEATQTLR
ncbi:MAG: hypothetical protein AAF570_27535, partial [Bacteroidota bacterium]